jgi:malonyl-ACP decarboxylase
MSSPGHASGETVVISSAAVLNAAGQTLDSYAAALRAGRSAITHCLGDGQQGQAYPAALLRSFNLGTWAECHLADDPAARRALLKAAARSAVPAQTAACAALLCARDAGLDRQQAARTAVIIAGSNLALEYHGQVAVAFHGGQVPLPSHALTHMDLDAVGAVSEATGCRGEGWCLGASAASGVVALIQGARLVRSGEADHCLVVGPSSELAPAELQAMADAGALARMSGSAPPATRCRPFDAARCGYALGQGAASVLVERLATALAARRAPLAVLAGYGLALDGRRGMDPSVEGQVAAMAQALRRAGLAPRDVDYVNAHAAGTVAGDECEARAIHAVFGSGPCVNSTKALIGHCMASAGLQEAIATVLQLREGFCHSNPNLAAPCHAGVSFARATPVRRTIRAAVKNGVGVSGVSAALVFTPAMEDS